MGRPIPLVWSFSDGSCVLLGDKVHGKTPFADALRADLERQRYEVVLVQVEPPPAEPVPLDFDLVPYVDAWVRAVALRFNVTVSGPPELEPGYVRPDDKVELDEDGRAPIY
jgi:hypothetical protein